MVVRFYQFKFKYCKTLKHHQQIIKLTINGHFKNKIILKKPKWGLWKTLKKTKNNEMNEIRFLQFKRD